MNQLAKIGDLAPELLLSDWVQGNPTQLHQLLGKVVLIEVFQVNCPGCFLYSLPQAVDLHQRYSNKGLVVLGVATAFEDFDKNNLQNLQLLLSQDRVIGETRRVLEAENKLSNDQLPYHIPFPVAMDSIVEENKRFSDDEITAYIEQNIPDFMYYNEQNQLAIKEQVLSFLQAQLIKPETFNLYALKGTPSHIIIDKKGLLRACELGSFSDLEWFITSLLQELK